MVNHHVTYQVIQSSHESFKLMLSDTALVKWSKCGAGPAHGASDVGFMDSSVQHDQVLLSTSRAQSCHLEEINQIQKIQPNNNHNL